MKTKNKPIRFTLAAALATALLWNSSSAFADGGPANAEPPFPQVISFELGASGFFQGDNITIDSVRGDRRHIESGGDYLVEGSYTLGSADKATLAFHCTTSGSSGGSPEQASQKIDISRGSGKFHLYKTNLINGWLHVSFYPNNSSLHGGVYFGEKGREESIMRHQYWYDDISGKTPRDKHSGATDLSTPALIHYLGDAVPPPSDMDAKYSRAGLSNAVQSGARNAGITIKGLVIDDEEFPFLVGVTCGGSDFGKLKAEIRNLAGYEYGGSVGNDGNSDGSDTCNAFSIVPYKAYPEESRLRIQHRLMLRYEVFYDQLTARK